MRRSPTRNPTTTGADEAAGRNAARGARCLRGMRADRRCVVPTIEGASRDRTVVAERRTGWMSRSALRRPRAFAAGATSAHRADAVDEAISAGGCRPEVPGRA